MKKSISIIAVLYVIFSVASLYASDAKVSAALNEGGALVIAGEANGSLYVLLQESLTKAKIKVYQPGLGSSKDFPINPNWGDNTLFVDCAIVGNKLSVFYQHFDTPKNKYQMAFSAGKMTEIFKQDYDLNTLALSGSPEKIFDMNEDGFTGLALKIARSDDNSKTAVLIESRLDESRCKVLVYDGKGKIYSKVINYKIEAKGVTVPVFKVSNDGSALVMAKNNSVTMHVGARKGRVSDYYFAVVNAQGLDVKNLTIADKQMEKVVFMTEPVANWLNNGQIAIAYGIYKSPGGNEVEAMKVGLYDADLKELNKKEIAADPKLVAQASVLDKSKIGFNWLIYTDLMPLSGGNFVVVAEYYRDKSENGGQNEQTIISRDYAVVYRFDEKLDMLNSAFISKKQMGVDIMDFVFGLKAAHVGDEPYFIYNDKFESKPSDGIQLYCMHLPASGEAQVSKLVRTTDSFYTSIDRIVTGEDGKLYTPALRIKGFYTGGAKGVKFVQINCK